MKELLGYSCCACEMLSLGAINLRGAETGRPVPETRRVLGRIDTYQDHPRSQRHPCGCRPLAVRSSTTDTPTAERSHIFGTSRTRPSFSYLTDLPSLPVDDPRSSSTLSRFRSHALQPQ